MSLEVSIRKHLPSFDLKVDFSAGNETFGLLGASGCGKSLTLKCIAGVATPDEGRIVVNGVTFFDSEEGIDLSPQQRKTALLFQNYMLFPNMTVEQNVAAGIDRKVLKAQRLEVIERELDRFDIKSFRGRYPSQLSGGQQQRVALARMLAANPGILMLDEPFSALDAHLRGMLEQNLIGLFEGYSGTILYVSHDIDEALRFCDRIAVFDDGRIREIDEGRSIVTEPKSLAAIKLSGCKNATEVQRIDAHTVLCPRWGVSFSFDKEVPESVRHLGIRAFSLERADEPGENVFKMLVERVSDSRFDRTALLSFAERLPDPKDAVSSGGIHQLHQQVIWRIDLRNADASKLPKKGEEVFARFPQDKIFLVSE